MKVALPYRAPLAWQAHLAFLAARAIPGVERVGDGVYRRTTAGGGVVAVRLENGSVIAEVRARTAAARADALARVRRVFDLDADPRAIAEVLGRDRLLGAALGACPGRRVPGGWDGLELAVRAILGQQVAVAQATRLAGALVGKWGTPLPRAGDGLTHAFPSAATLAGAGGDAIAGELGMPRARGRAIAEIARAVAEDRVALEGASSLDAFVERLTALPGIGPWTAHYLAMRLGHADAFPAGDLGLRRVLGLDEKQLRARAEAWRPFRAYAAVHVWAYPVKGVRT